MLVCSISLLSPLISLHKPALLTIKRKGRTALHIHSIYTRNNRLKLQNGMFRLKRKKKKKKNFLVKKDRRNGYSAG